MILFGFLLPMFAPWIPIINRIPRWIPLYKIIYRQYYASMAGGPPPAEVTSEPASPPPPPAPPGQTDRRRPDDVDNSLVGLNDQTLHSEPQSAIARGTLSPRFAR